MSVSNHTFLQNFVIWLVIRENDHFDFKNLGFKLQWIEQSIKVEYLPRKTGFVKIDVIASSPSRNTTICFEVKGGKTAGYDGDDQFLKYQVLSSDDLKLFITLDDPIVEICYVVMNENLESILSLLRPNVTRSTIFLDVSKDNESYGFQTLGEQTSFSRILPPRVSYKLSKIPFNFYPFSSDDKLNWIMPKVIQGCISLIIKNMTEEDETITWISSNILEEVFPLATVKFMDQGEIKKLSQKIDRILYKINNSGPTKHKLQRLARSPYVWKSRVNQTELLASLKKLRSEIKQETSLDDYLKPKG